MKKILIADDHEIVRIGSSNILKKIFPESLIFHAENLEEIDKIISSNEIDIALIDIKMPGGSTFDLIKDLKVNHPNMKILMFSALNENHFGRIYIKLGVNGFLSKLKPIDEVEKAIEVIMNGNQYMSVDLETTLNSKNIKKSIIDLLSARELEIMDLIEDGYGNLEISKELDLKSSTVSTYKKRIMEKFEVNGIVELIDAYRNLLSDFKE